MVLSKGQLTSQETELNVVQTEEPLKRKGKQSRNKRSKHQLLISDRSTPSSSEDTGNIDSIDNESSDSESELPEHNISDRTTGLSFPSGKRKQKAALEVSRENATKMATLRGFLIPHSILFLSFLATTQTSIVGLGCGAEGLQVWIGRKVLVGCRKSRSWKGIITEYLTGTEAVKIHYDGFQQFYDEIVVSACTCIEVHISFCAELMQNLYTVYYLIGNRKYSFT